MCYTTLVAALLLSACSDGIIEPNNTHDGPGTPAGVVERDTLLVGFQNDTLAFELVGGESGQVLHRRILDTTGEGERDKFRFIDGAELDRERRVLIALIRPRQSERREMIALALPHMETLWRVRAKDIEADAEPGVDLTFTRLLGIDLRGRWFYLRGDRGEEEHGVLVVDRQTRTPVTFLGGFLKEVIPLAHVAGNVEGPDLLVASGKRSEEAVRLMIYEVDDLRLRDSVLVATPFGQRVNSVRLDALVSGQDGRHVFALTKDSLFKVDVRCGAVVARARRQRPFLISRMALARDPPRLFLTATGSFDFPGNGKLQVYDGELRNLGSVDLGVSSMLGLDVGERGDLLFVLSGTSKGQLFDLPTNIFVVDIAKLSLVATHEIGGSGASPLFAF